MESFGERNGFRFFLGILAFLIVHVVLGQNIERFSNKEGFNQNTINTIQQDKYGFLWYGTPNGLIRYDGYTFKTYVREIGESQGLVSNYITFLFSDSQGILWIGSNIGLNVYVPWLEKFYAVPLKNRQYVRQIKAGKDGKIVFLGDEDLSECELLDPAKGTFKTTEGLLGEFSDRYAINDFNFLEEDALLLATNVGLQSLKVKWDPSRHVQVVSETGQAVFEGKDISVFLVNKSNKKLYIGTADSFNVAEWNIDGQLKILKSFGGSKAKYKMAQPLYVQTMFEDGSNAIWLGTRRQGVYQFNDEGELIRHFGYDTFDEKGISSANINSLYMDEFNVLWIGTAQGGLNKLDLTQKPFLVYSHNPYDKQSIADNLLMDILEDSKGRLWLAGFNEPLIRSVGIVNDHTVRNLKFENLRGQFNLIENDIVRCLYEDNKGFIWIGSDRSIAVYELNTNQFKRIDLEDRGETLQPVTIRDICQIDKDHVLLAGDRIVLLENPWDEIKKSAKPRLKVGSRMTSQFGRGKVILKDQDDRFWLGTSKALLDCSFNGEDIVINHDYSANGNNAAFAYHDVFSLYKDGKGRLWIGSFGGGLNKLVLDDHAEPKNGELFNKNNLLPDDAVYGILEDRSKYLWISTDMGLVKFNPSDNSVNLFDVRDGLPQNNFREVAHFSGKSGYFYFGGLNGLTLFKPEEVKLKNQTPKVLISELIIDNKPFKIGEEINGNRVLSRSITETKGIRIPRSLRNLSFSVVVRQTSSPSKNSLSYKLEGFNDDWVHEDLGKTTINYTNLTAGNYVLKIKAANSDGVWSEHVKEIAIEVLPYWYNTWWSYLLFFIIFAGVIVGIMAYFVRLEKLNQRLKFEELDKERIEIINQGKFRYFTNLSHEFRTPLTLISGPLEQLMTDNVNPDNLAYLSIIKKNTKRLLNLANQLITFREVEEGGVKLTPSKLTLGEFLYPTTEAFENYANEKNINFFYKIATPNETLVTDVEKLERILYNLLSNAFKNTPPDGAIWIEARVENVLEKKTIFIDVVDTGRGIPQESLEKIFERFYRLGEKGGENVGGGGIGLAFSRSLVQLLGGEISVKSEEGVETRFSLTIPSGSEEPFLTQNETASKSYVHDWVPLSNENPSTPVLWTEDRQSEKKSLLLVEDEVDIQQFLLRALSAKYDVAVAGNGLEALKMIKKKEPDLIISDVMMPEMDGFTFCEQIKSNADTSHIPLLLLTALGDEENLIKGLEYGADEYLSKPFSLKHLELRLEKLINNTLRIKEYFSKNSFLPENKDDLGITKRDQEFLEDLNAHIANHLSNSEFGVEELSKELNLSPSHLYRRLKKLTGQVPNVYLRNFRLQRAAELLESHEGYNVAEVMYQIGIESHSYFSSSFKKLFGVSPSQYARKN